ncbi:MAG: hypothetical protein LLF98_03325 [Clostridium sp.]|uniref:hypothetical protein n=1 Tax=Clostridium sp. TaxID=1506 RepID=UPI0025C501FB|nr:hypothetical protein [Clostridium sp.]MCE5220305.1 hypothetical protein [Clostridium sp.]
MEVKVINNKLEDCGSVFKVRRMNFDKIIVNYPIDSGIKSFSFADVECISENNIDEFLIKNRNFLKIKLKRGMSVVFYNALYDSLKLEIKEEIKNLNVLIDKYKINKRGIWEKEILLLINNKFPLEVIASGQNFKRNGYNIIINEVEKDNFLEICNAEIKNIKSQIELKKGAISSFIDAIEQFKNSNKISQESVQ